MTEQSGGELAYEQLLREAEQSEVEKLGKFVMREISEND